MVRECSFALTGRVTGRRVTGRRVTGRRVTGRVSYITFKKRSRLFERCFYVLFSCSATTRLPAFGVHGIVGSRPFFGVLFDVHHAASLRFRETPERPGGR